MTTKLGIPEEKILAGGQLTVFDEPNRDPRGPTLSVTMWAVISSDEVPGSAEWVSWDNPGDLAFDHNRIVADTRPILADTLLWRDQAFTRALLGPSFPASYALAVAEELSGVRPDPGNLNRTLKSLPGLERTDEQHQIFTNGPVGWPGVRRETHDFTEIIRAAQALPGFAETARKRSVMVDLGTKPSWSSPTKCCERSRASSTISSSWAAAMAPPGT